MAKRDSYQQVFEMILNQTTDMLLIVDQNRRTVFSTPNFIEICGYNLEELQNMDVFDVVHPDDKEYMLERHKNLLASQQSNSTEYRIIDKYGEVRHFECKTTPLPNTENFLQVVSVRDITERKLMEMELERRKTRYEVLQKSLKNFSRDLSLVMKLAELEERLLRELEVILPNSQPDILKIPSGEETSEWHHTEPSIVQLAVGKMEVVHDRMWMKIGEKKECLYIISINKEAISEKMESIWLETIVYYTVIFIENLHVIEDLMHQLESAIQSRGTPQWVLRLLFNLQEQQRMNLSSDLHDTVLQDQIDLFRRLESLLNINEIEKESRDKLKGIEQGLLDIIHQIRMTCNDLRPPLLRELGLENALENLFEHIQLTSTFKIIFTSQNNPNLLLSEEQTIGIYRIVQELLKNAEKHSRASLLKFHIYHENDCLKMVYTDNGVGLDVIKLDPSFNSMGLTSMTQRAQSLGGKMDFHSKPGSGLKAALKLPITKEWS